MTFVIQEKLFSKHGFTWGIVWFWQEKRYFFLEMTKFFIFTPLSWLIFFHPDINDFLNIPLNVSCINFIFNIKKIFYYKIFKFINNIYGFAQMALVTIRFANAKSNIWRFDLVTWALCVLQRHFWGLPDYGFYPLHTYIII